MKVYDCIIQLFFTTSMMFSSDTSQELKIEYDYVMICGGILNTARLKNE